MSPKSTGAVFEAHYEDSEQEVEVTLVLDYPTQQFFLTVGDTPTAVIDPVNALILGNFLTSHLGNTGSINVTEQVREIGGPDPNRRLAEGETVADRALTESALYADWLERETAAESTDEPLFQGTAKVELGADGKPTGQFNPEGSPKTPELTYLQEDDLRTIAELGDLRNQLSTQYDELIRAEAEKIAQGMLRTFLEERAQATSTRAPTPLLIDMDNDTFAAAVIEHLESGSG